MVENKLVHLVFGRNYNQNYIEIVKNNFLDFRFFNEQEREIVFCVDLESLINTLQTRIVKTIVIHPIELNYNNIIELVSMIKTFCKVINYQEKIDFSVVVYKNLDYLVLKELQKSDILGIIPSSVEFGPDEAKKSLEALFSGIPYWPKHIIEQIKNYPTKTKLIDNKINLTTRQAQIFRLVTEKGSSNKVIARMLNISESTVKLHMSQIFKKFGVKTRTQLAVYSRQ